MKKKLYKTKIIIPLVFCFAICIAGCSKKASIDSAENEGAVSPAQTALPVEASQQLDSTPLPQDEAPQTPDSTDIPQDVVSPTPELTETSQNDILQTPISTVTNDIAENDGIKVTVSGKELTFDGQQPIHKNGEVLIPVYGVFEKLDGANGNKDAPFTVKEDDATSTVTIKNKWYTVSITEEKQTFTCNGKEITAGTPSQRINGVLMLPLRAIAEAMDVTVEGDEAAGTISIFYESMESIILVN